MKTTQFQNELLGMLFEKDGDWIALRDIEQALGGGRSSANVLWALHGMDEALLTEKSTSGWRITSSGREHWKRRVADAAQKALGVQPFDVNQQVLTVIQYPHTKIT